MIPPSIIYGTAWKKDMTAEYVFKAVSSGFRAIDTACQPKHYNEAGVGVALEQLYHEHIVKRSDLFLQTKFTAVNGQNPERIPYDPNAPLEDQIRQSLAKSLENLRTTYLDSMLLHSPQDTYPDTLRAWRVLESFVSDNTVKHIGISNIYDVRELARLYEDAAIKPKFVQNRFYDRSHYDKVLREFCASRGIIYQSFWTLTANPHIVNGPTIQNLSLRYSKTREQIFYSFVRHLGIVPISGTKSLQHMVDDLEVEDIKLSAAEVQFIREEMKI